MPPVLLLLTGAPASGKSRLAARLAAELAWPLLSRDRIRELLWDALPSEGDARGASSDAAWRLFYSLTEDLLFNGSNVVAESSLHFRRSVNELQPVLSRATTAHIHLDCDRAIRVERYAARVAGRHPCFNDSALAQRYREEPDRWVYFEEPPALDVPLLRLNTSTGEDRLEQALAFVRTFG
ncbi:hypothetical protein DAETH_29250 [Deinococcus aetherius]|uniref:Kinase n=1 Tax=Deinococcus aetherius TaxID=200252 RepID=A0ABN6RMH8_9DEIO|nr:ATP-binding protein [Deinococcus aetherius]BDP42956.1 hypothetical protein DAETH_29250 [Deinococcus aetherius]